MKHKQLPNMLYVGIQKPLVYEIDRQINYLGDDIFNVYSHIFNVYSHISYDTISVRHLYHFIHIAIANLNEYGIVL